MKLIKELVLRSKETYIPVSPFPYIYAALVDTDKAIAYLEKGYEERAFQMQFLKIDPRWDNLRDDPRFTDLMRRVGLSK